MNYDKLMDSIINELADDSIVDTALADAMQNSDNDLSDPSTVIMAANENDDVPDEFSETNPVTSVDIEIAAKNIADIPDDVEIPDYDDIDIALASDTQEDSSIIDDDEFSEDPEGIEVFYNSDFRRDEELDENMVEKFTPKWVNIIEESIIKADELIESIREARINMIAKANNIDDLLALDRVGIF